MTSSGPTVSWGSAPTSASTRPGRYSMAGRYGQLAVIDPQGRAAVTVTAHTERENDLFDAIHAVLDKVTGAA
jgi:CubicO group peptidase (beta-lactamase class C family)